MTPPQALVMGVSAIGSGMGFLLVHADGYGGVSLFTIGLIVCGFVGIAYRLRVFESLLLLGAVTALATLATWHIPEIAHFSGRQLVDGMDLKTVFGPLTELQLAGFAGSAVGVGLLFGLAGYIGVIKSRTHGLWAAVSGAVPLAVLAVSYWRMDALGVDFLWALISLGLGAVATVAAARIAKRRHLPGMETALGIYAIAVIAAISLGAAMALEETWLTMALAAQLPAAAWVHVHFTIPHLRPASLAVATVVGARLVLLHFLPGSPFEGPVGAGWILYSYGVPAVAFGLAAHWFRETADDRLVMALEAGTVALGVTLVNMQIRHFVGTATFWFERYDLFEQSLQAIAWLATGYGLYRRQRTRPRPVHMWSARLLIGLAALQVIFLQAGISNPLLTGADVWAAPVFNLLLLAYGVPALFAVLVHREALHQGHRAVANWAGILALGLIFLNLSLEVRHLFHGNHLDIGPMSNAEGYSYSLAWLVYAGVLLGLGIVFGIVQLRHASLGLILLVVAKVFLWDMAWLTGLYRVGSFLGLGAILVTVGHLYQKYVLQLDRGEKSPQSE